MRVPELQDRPAYDGLFHPDHGAAAASTRLTVLTTATAAICGQARYGTMFTSCRLGATPLQPMYTKGSTIFTRSTDALPTRSASAGSKMCPTHLVSNTIWDRLQSRMALFLWHRPGSSGRHRRSECHTGHWVALQQPVHPHRQLRSQWFLPGTGPGRSGRY